MQEIPTVTIEAEFDSTARTGVFELGPADQWSLAHRQRTGTLVESGGSSVLDLLSRLTDEVDSESQAIRINAGGQRLWEVSAETPGPEATDNNGNPLQWGSSADPGAETRHSATGQDRITQADVFHAFLARSTGDSFTPATFAFGEYSSSGRFSPVSVAIEGPETRLPGDGTTGRIELTMVQVADITQPLSVIDQKD